MPDNSTRNRLLTAAAVWIACMGVTWTASNAASPSTLSIVATLTQAVLMFLGAIVSVTPDQSKEYRFPILLAFAVVGGLGMVVSIQQGLKSSKEAAETQTNLTNA